MNPALLNNLFMVVIIAVLILFMWLSTRKQRKRQQEWPLGRDYRYRQRQDVN